MRNISKFFIENYKFSIVLTVFMIIAGVSGLLSINAESFPTVNIGQVIIQTVYPGASADDIETKITKPIEDEIRSITGLDEVKSVSQPGLSRIFTVVDIDKYAAEKVVADLQRAVDRVSDLPADLDNPPSFIEVKTEEFPVIELAITGTNKDRIRDRAADKIVEAIEDNKAVSSIIKTGYLDRQFNILIDPAKLKRYHVGFDELTRKIMAENLSIPGGSIESFDNKTLVKIDGKRKSADQIGKIVIRSNFSGEKILLRDVAEITDGTKEPLIEALYNDENATFITISKKSGADLLSLAKDVETVVADFNEKYTGAVSFKIFNNEGVRVGNRLEILKSNALAGLFLVVLFLILFLPGRSGIMAAFSLPLATLATFSYMHLSDMTLNTITILAMVISIGMLVDNSVVISENFNRLVSEGFTSKKAILRSIKTLWLPITGTALTTIAAFLPMLVTKGIVGQFIRGIPIVVTAALVLSLFESFILLPVRLVKPKEAEAKETKGDEDIGETDEEPEGHDWFSRFIIPPFESLVKSLITHRYLTLILFSAIIIGSLFLMIGANRFVLFPAQQTEIYIARAEMPRGTPLALTTKVSSQIAKNIKKALGDSVAHIASTTGRSETQPNDPKSKSGANVALFRIFVTEKAKNTLNTADVLSTLRAIPKPENAIVSFEAIANGPPASDPVAGIIRSNNLAELSEATKILSEKLSNTKGVVDVQIDDVFSEDEILVRVDTEAADRLGLNLQTIGNTVRTAFAGSSISDVSIDNKDVDFFVRLKAEARENIEELKSLMILNMRGDLIPLGRIASLEKQSGVPYRKRFDYKPAKTITANVEDQIITAQKANQLLQSYFDDVQKRFPEVSLTFGGEGERIRESMSSLASALGLAVIGIFALLVFLFKSFVKPLIILTTIPLGLFGVAVSFYIHQMPISFLALIGVVGLSGIIVNSGIVLISFVDQLRTGSNQTLHDVLQKAAGLRLRAVIVTSLTTVSGLLPTSYGVGGADQFIIPMTMAMAWGLVSGTILALLWVPCAYAIVEDVNTMFKKIFAQRHRDMKASATKLEA